jgi:methylmalonyl-CoA mutase, N-terminal domain
VDDSIRAVQAESLKALRSRRDHAQAKECLARIASAAADGSNLMPHVITAVEQRCTLGEISDELRKVFGEYK